MVVRHACIILTIDDHAFLSKCFRNGSYRDLSHTRQLVRKILNSGQRQSSASFQLIAMGNKQGFIAILPFCLSIEKSMPYPKHPRTIGEHIFKRRCELELFQKEVGKQIGVSARTIMNWEKGYSEPDIRYFPAIFAILGYDPFPEPKTLGEKIIAWRRQNGVTRKSLARQLGIDDAALAKREMGLASTTEEKAIRLTSFLEQQFGSVSALHERGGTN